ncbi:putative polyphosphoinositide phosphatase [Monocercomonoides exilis]|uniref:putative polyphosphoinositide phosphatase n=1 Tax=Monocercomonoides exilis TaxID=2049356 RepID=UPI003559BEE1|nr:putative polyphosphoinositide phosphatase [Monocercomonoides exilis]|eukprot:MONOS_2718.1-p1 / transcript=MONOS_2718.1 / gene=MONOS_2718 / organism=Monocercomonoides_exilis_PA203 / gene_product=polyphosphoinositide phosphatase / transcript_product=polyphosphoinositide phosphatase / location=Mono_scaffold00057:103572-115037(+) / protein_length=3796 / sequence_SO=supercontig / SO=protein_coding / is_pseudo=false
MNEYLISVNSSCKATGGMKQLGKACGIIGFCKGILGYFIIFIQSLRQVGFLGDHKIFGIESVLQIPLATQEYLKAQQLTSEQKREDERYRKYFNEIPFNRDFFFSYTLDMTRTLQSNISTSLPYRPPQNDIVARKSSNYLQKGNPLPFDFRQFLNRTPQQCRLFTSHIPSMIATPPTESPPKTLSTKSPEIAPMLFTQTQTPLPQPPSRQKQRASNITTSALPALPRALSSSGASSPSLVTFPTTSASSFNSSSSQPSPYASAVALAGSPSSFQSMPTLPSLQPLQFPLSSSTQILHTASASPLVPSPSLSPQHLVSRTDKTLSPFLQSQKPSQFDPAQYEVVDFESFLDTQRRLAIDRIESNQSTGSANTNEEEAEEAEKGHSYERSTSFSIKPYNGSTNHSSGRSKQDLPTEKMAHRRDSLLVSIGCSSSDSRLRGCVEQDKNWLSSSPSAFFYTRELFVWNSFLLRSAVKQLSNPFDWLVLLINGFFSQHTFNQRGHLFSVALVARRSRHFAGTRFQKRGISERGWVANDVETELVVWDSETATTTASSRFASFVQHRGSPPVFWAQDADAVLPKPPIIYPKHDPFFDATTCHFADLYGRYGTPIIALSLLHLHEKKKRESPIDALYNKAVKTINKTLQEQDRIIYVPFDFNQCLKHDEINVNDRLLRIAQRAVMLNGVFYAEKYGDSTINTSSGQTEERKGGIVIHSMQSGCIRTNCLDCLDRTSSAQLCICIAGLARCLSLMNMWLSPSEAHTVLETVAKMHTDLGDAVAQIYGGSDAIKKVDSLEKGSTARLPTGQNAISNLKRFISNTFQNLTRQQAFNVFLGVYPPFLSETVWMIMSQQRDAEQDNKSSILLRATSSVSDSLSSASVTQAEDANMDAKRKLAKEKEEKQKEKERKEKEKKEKERLEKEKKEKEKEMKRKRKEKGEKDGEGGVDDDDEEAINQLRGMTAEEEEEKHIVRSRLVAQLTMTAPHNDAAMDMSPLNIPSPESYPSSLPPSSLSPSTLEQNTQPAALASPTQQQDSVSLPEGDYPTTSVSSIPFDHFEPYGSADMARTPPSLSIPSLSLNPGAQRDPFDTSSEASPFQMEKQETDNKGFRPRSVSLSLPVEAAKMLKPMNLEESAKLWKFSATPSRTAERFKQEDSLLEGEASAPSGALQPASVSAADASADSDISADSKAASPTSASSATLPSFYRSQSKQMTRPLATFVHPQLTLIRSRDRHRIVYPLPFSIAIRPVPRWVPGIPLPRSLDFILNFPFLANFLLTWHNSQSISTQLNIAKERLMQMKNADSYCGGSNAAQEQMKTPESFVRSFTLTSQQSSISEDGTLLSASSIPFSSQSSPMAENVPILLNANRQFSSFSSSSSLALSSSSSVSSPLSSPPSSSSFLSSDYVKFEGSAPSLPSILSRAMNSSPSNDHLLPAGTDAPVTQGQAPPTTALSLLSHSETASDAKSEGVVEPSALSDSSPLIQRPSALYASSFEEQSPDSFSYAMQSQSASSSRDADSKQGKVSTFTVQNSQQTKTTSNKSNLSPVKSTIKTAALAEATASKAEVSMAANIQPPELTTFAPSTIPALLLPIWEIESDVTLHSQLPRLSFAVSVRKQVSNRVKQEEFQRKKEIDAAAQEEQQRGSDDAQSQVQAHNTPLIQNCAFWSSDFNLTEPHLLPWWVTSRVLFELSHAPVLQSPLPFFPKTCPLFKEDSANNAESDALKSSCSGNNLESSSNSVEIQRREGNVFITPQKRKRTPEPADSIANPHSSICNRPFSFYLLPNHLTSFDHRLSSPGVPQQTRLLYNSHVDLSKVTFTEVWFNFFFMRMERERKRSTSRWSMAARLQRLRNSKIRTLSCFEPWNCTEDKLKELAMPIAAATTTTSEAKVKGTNEKHLTQLAEVMEKTPEKLYGISSSSHSLSASVQLCQQNISSLQSSQLAPSQFVRRNSHLLSFSSANPTVPAKYIQTQRQLSNHQLRRLQQPPSQPHSDAQKTQSEGNNNSLQLQQKTFVSSSESVNVIVTQQPLSVAHLLSVSSFDPLEVQRLEMTSGSTGLIQIIDSYRFYSSLGSFVSASLSPNKNQHHKLAFAPLTNSSLSSSLTSNQIASSSPSSPATQAQSSDISSEAINFYQTILSTPSFLLATQQPTVHTLSLLCRPSADGLLRQRIKDITFSDCAGTPSSLNASSLQSAFPAQFSPSNTKRISSRLFASFSHSSQKPLNSPPRPSSSTLSLSVKDDLFGTNKTHSTSYYAALSPPESPTPHFKTIHPHVRRSSATFTLTPASQHAPFASATDSTKSSVNKEIPDQIWRYRYSYATQPANEAQMQKIVSENLFDSNKPCFFASALTQPNSNKSQQHQNPLSSHSFASMSSSVSSSLAADTAFIDGSTEFQSLSSIPTLKSALASSIFTRPDSSRPPSLAAQLLRQHHPPLRRAASQCCSVTSSSIQSMQQRVLTHPALLLIQQRRMRMIQQMNSDRLYSSPAFHLASKVPLDELPQPVFSPASIRHYRCGTREAMEEDEEERRRLIAQLQKKSIPSAGFFSGVSLFMTSSPHQRRSPSNSPSSSPPSSPALSSDDEAAVAVSSPTHQHILSPPPVVLQPILASAPQTSQSSAAKSAADEGNEQQKDRKVSMDDSCSSQLQSPLNSSVSSTHIISSASTSSFLSASQLLSSSSSVSSLSRKPFQSQVIRFVDHSPPPSKQRHTRSLAQPSTPIVSISTPKASHVFSPSTLTPVGSLNSYNQDSLRSSSPPPVLLVKSMTTTQLPVHFRSRTPPPSSSKPSSLGSVADSSSSAAFEKVSSSATSSPLNLSSDSIVRPLRKGSLVPIPSFSNQKLTTLTPQPRLSTGHSSLHRNRRITDAAAMLQDALFPAPFVSVDTASLVQDVDPTDHFQTNLINMLKKKAQKKQAPRKVNRLLWNSRKSLEMKRANSGIASNATAATTATRSRSSSYSSPHQYRLPHSSSFITTERTSDGVFVSKDNRSKAASGYTSLSKGNTHLSRNVASSSYLLDTMREEKKWKQHEYSRISDWMLRLTQLQKEQMEDNQPAKDETRLQAPTPLQSQSFIPHRIVTSSEMASTSSPSSPPSSYRFLPTRSQNSIQNTSLPPQCVQNKESGALFIRFSSDPFCTTCYKTETGNSTAQTKQTEKDYSVLDPLICVRESRNAPITMKRNWFDWYGDMMKKEMGWDKPLTADATIEAKQNASARFTKTAQEEMMRIPNTSNGLSLNNSSPQSLVRTQSGSLLSPKNVASDASATCQSGSYEQNLMLKVGTVSPQPIDKKLSSVNSENLNGQRSTRTKSDSFSLRQNNNANNVNTKSESIIQDRQMQNGIYTNNALQRNEKFTINRNQDNRTSISNLHLKKGATKARGRRKAEDTESDSETSTSTSASSSSTCDSSETSSEYSPTLFEVPSDSASSVSSQTSLSSASLESSLDADVTLCSQTQSALLNQTSSSLSSHLFAHLFESIATATVAHIPLVFPPSLSACHAIAVQMANSPFDRVGISLEIIDEDPVAFTHPLFPPRMSKAHYKPKQYKGFLLTNIEREDELQTSLSRMQNMNASNVLQNQQLSPLVSSTAKPNAFSPTLSPNQVPSFSGIGSPSSASQSSQIISGSNSFTTWSRFSSHSTSFARTPTLTLDSLARPLTRFSYPYVPTPESSLPFHTIVSSSSPSMLLRNARSKLKETTGQVLTPRLVQISTSSFVRCLQEIRTGNASWKSLFSKIFTPVSSSKSLQNAACSNRTNSNILRDQVKSYSSCNNKENIPSTFEKVNGRDEEDEDSSSESSSFESIYDDTSLVSLVQREIEMLFTF